MTDYRFTVLGGDFKRGKGTFSDGWVFKTLRLPPFGLRTRHAKEIESPEILTDVDVKKARKSKAQAATMGFLFLGVPIEFGRKPKEELTFVV